MDPVSDMKSILRGDVNSDTIYNKSLILLQMVFINPSKLLCAVLCLQLALILLQLCLLFSSIPWHNFLSIVILLFINYYTLFKLVRDYLVAWKVYKAENMIQEKNGITQVSN